MKRSCGCDLDAELEAAYRRGARWRWPALIALGIILLFILRVTLGWQRIEQRTQIYKEILKAEQRIK